MCFKIATGIVLHQSFCRLMLPESGKGLHHEETELSRDPIAH